MSMFQEGVLFNRRIQKGFLILIIGIEEIVHDHYPRIPVKEDF